MIGGIISPYLNKCNVLMKKGILIFAILVLPCVLYGQTLKFRSDGTFKIVQITDMHIDLQEGQSDVCFQLIKDAVERENPDLIVFTGDLITEYHPEKTWRYFVEQVEKENVYWTMIFGNHDHEQGMTHEEIFDIVSQASHCLVDAGKVKGCGNFVLPIKSSQSDTIAFGLYFLDTHGNCEEKGVGGYQWVDFSQIDWFIKESSLRSCLSLVFLHIPLPEYNDVLKSKIVGEKGEDICSPRLNSGLFTALKEAGNVLGVFSGHDHENDFVGLYYDIALAYGRVGAGKNAYGSLMPGMRVIVLKEGVRDFETYVCLENGEIINKCKIPNDFVME